MDCYFTAKILGKVEKTQDIIVASKWRQRGLLVLVTSGTYERHVAMRKGEAVRKIKLGDTFDEILDLAQRGYSFVSTKRNSLSWNRSVDEETSKSSGQLFNDTLVDIAKVIEPTNAQKAAYFRDTPPYQDGRLLAVDFPTKGKWLQRAVEQFQQEGKPYAVKKLYHGTKLHLLPSIVQRGLRRSRDGFLGRGIYLGSLQKALNYTNLIILEVMAALGHCKEITKREDLEANPDFDSLHASAGPLPGSYGGTLNNEEWVVRYPQQVEVVRLVAFA